MNQTLRRIRALSSKEFRHLLRDQKTLLIVFAQPVLLLVLYGSALSFDLKRIPFAVWDQDRSESSRQFVNRLAAGGEDRIFSVIGYIQRPDQAERLLASGEARFVLVMPHDFERDMSSGRVPTVQALFDAAESNTAGIAAGYLGAAVASQNSRLATTSVARSHGAHTGSRATGTLLGGESPVSETINLRWRVFYNPQLKSVNYVVPGLMAILLTFLAATLTSTTIVRERELGPMESLYTSPVNALELVMGKLLPYIAVAAGNITLVLLVGGLMFGVWPRGDLLTLASFSLLFLLAMLAIGMLISAVAESQQTALLFAILLTMLPNMFLTGFAFPRSNMPWLLQLISAPLPATQYLMAIRGVFLKGAGWDVYWPQGLFLAVISVVLLALAVRIVGKSMERGLG